jgi:hypothetical protein
MYCFTGILCYERFSKCAQLVIVFHGWRSLDDDAGILHMERIALQK